MWVFVSLPRLGQPSVMQCPADSLPEAWPFPDAADGEVLVFRPGLGMTLAAGIHQPPRWSDWATHLPAERATEIPLRVWLCGTLSGSLEAAREAEWQVASLNQCLAQGAAPADSGIRAKLLEVRSAPELQLDDAISIECVSSMSAASPEPHVTDVYLHSSPFTARACPLRNRIFLGLPRMERYMLAHELAHLLGMSSRAHVDDNPYLRRGNVMDTAPAGGKGALTLGQICIFNLDVQSLAARIRGNRDTRFPLRRCIDESAKPVRGPSLGFHFPAV